MAHKKNALPTDNQVPRHIGIIMDGNGRWAKQRGLGRSLGHKQGAKVFENTVRACKELGIQVLTVYAFSTENWKRPQEEVDAIMNLLRDYLTNADKHRDEAVRMRFLGDRTPLDADLCAKMAEIEAKSKECTGITVNVALNYGGRDEIVRAVREIAKQVQAGTLTSDAITQADIEAALYTEGQPDPDLIIRPSGEQRLSNFLIWQAAYSEFVFMDVLWPDFTKKHLLAALAQYASRDRRFGGI